ncbi:SDR family NAD(P)-dependent oxidoreductase [Actinomadura darangshiensis]|uniref:SDR family NAD(P)-dependent oxidoreductase n=1 Tax=Actinomadura darangshiensis TaxID=705336 RepID=UPI001FB627EC|nr:SDR family NAD(P)-dependent oxidoreductase [Actinomadura darangshiensis]
MVEQRVAMVTGANKGIGFAVAGGRLRQGIVVYLGARDTARGDQAAAELAEVGPVRSVFLDVTDAESIAAAADRIETDEGVLDILVNNAGILVQPLHPPSQTPVQDVRQTYETNVFGVIAVTNGLLPLLRKSRAARIVNLTSDLGSVAKAADDPNFPQLLAYNSSKAALNAVTVTYAKRAARPEHPRQRRIAWLCRH